MENKQAHMIHECTRNFYVKRNSPVTQWAFGEHKASLVHSTPILLAVSTPLGPSMWMTKPILKVGEKVNFSTLLPLTFTIPSLKFQTLCQY